MFDYIVGQSEVKEALKINVGACKTENKVLPHSLFIGPPGLGKTTFANAVSDELGVELEITNGANLRTVKSLLPFLMRVTPKSVLFIDEIHSCGKQVFNYLLTVMEQFIATIGDETIKLPQFCLIGATTNAGDLIKPLYDRFITKYSLQPYKPGEIKEIIKNSLGDLVFSESALDVLVKSSKNVPRIAKNRLTFIQNYAIFKGTKNISEQDVLWCLDKEGVREDGLDKNDIKYLQTLKKIQPAGISTLSAALNISRDEIENVIEPYLLQKLYIKRTPKGRVLS